MNFKAVGGRTFILTVGCGIVTSLMRVFDVLEDGSYVAIITASVCTYIAKAGWDEHSKTRADVDKTIGAK